MGTAWEGADNLAFVEQITGFTEELKVMATKLSLASQALEKQKSNYVSQQENNETVTLQMFVDEYKYSDKVDAGVMNIIVSAVESNKEYGSIVFVNQSACHTNNTSAVTDDLIQACTFMDVEENYYVFYRYVARQLNNINTSVVTESYAQAHSEG